MNDGLEVAADSEGALLLDPFGSQPHRVSRIAGLGGAEPSPDPSYVFQTVDCRPAIGMVCATVRFLDLAVTYGTLLFEIRARPAVPGAEPSRLDTVVVDAEELVAADGVVQLSFESYRNVYYAIACSINEGTDISAAGISVAIDRRATPAQHGREWDWSADRERLARRRPGIEALLIGRSLTDVSQPTLASPMSQAASPRQCREPAFAEAMTALRTAPAPTLANWSLAYVVQAIGRFGYPKPGRMLSYGEGQGALLSHYVGQGCEVAGIRHAEDPREQVDPGRELQSLWRPDLCDEEEFFAHAHYLIGDIRQPVAPFLDQFDVLWSINANRLMTPGEFVYFAVNGLAHVRPGGVAVHVFDYCEDPVADRGTSLLRHDIERLATLALSHRNDVARLHFRHGATLPFRGAALPFGMILIRGGRPDG